MHAYKPHEEEGHFQCVRNPSVNEWTVKIRDFPVGEWQRVAHFRLCGRELQNSKGRAAQQGAASAVTQGVSRGSPPGGWGVGG